MNVQQRAVSTVLRQRDLTPQDYLEIAWRRKWWIVICVMLGAGVAYAFSLTLPPFYQSSTLILVEPPRVSGAYITPMINTSVDDRLRTISQQILSRTNLSRIIKDLGLFRGENAPATSSGPGQRSFLDQVKSKG